ncbi:hypothetical protein BMS3Abin07_01523 [bacterium BMS3Abin07]|nr:hypothetical protein BMS3Abin07_01523 [bacterium BMS3Abin07]GBE32644.1 hypothetical protein BMS3Bbin05_01561 [bacterium BMS3Bbin05]
MNKKETMESYTCGHDAESDDIPGIDISKTTVCPYCGIKFGRASEVLIHILSFHSG